PGRDRRSRFFRRRGRAQPDAVRAARPGGPRLPGGQGSGAKPARVEGLQLLAAGDLQRDRGRPRDQPPRRVRGLLHHRRERERPMSTVQRTLVMLLLAAGCGSQLVEFANSIPTVISTNPADKATAVGVNTTVAAVFSEPMDPASIDQNSFT